MMSSLPLSLHLESIIVRASWGAKPDRFTHRLSTLNIPTCLCAYSTVHTNESKREELRLSDQRWGTTSDIDTL